MELKKLDLFQKNQIISQKLSTIVDMEEITKKSHEKQRNQNNEKKNFGGKTIKIW